MKHDMTTRDAPPSWQMPTRAAALGFWWRSTLLKLWRGGKNLLDPSLRRWNVASELIDAPIAAQLRAPLWLDGRDDEFALIAGKVQNLRIAAKSLDGIEIPADQCLSFWRQIGRPSRWRRYVPGREVRSGCVIPTIAGGICQMSNALATCASRAGLELVERHAHSARVEQTQAREDQIDATVFWNYIDLRIRAAQPWRLEVTLTDKELVLTIRMRAQAARQPSARARPVIALRLDTSPDQPKPVARGCLTCDEQSCYLHSPQHRGQHSREAWLLDAWTPEFEQWLRERGTNKPEANHKKQNGQLSVADPFLPILSSKFPGGHAARRWLSSAIDAHGRKTPAWPITILRRAVAQRLGKLWHRPRQASLTVGQRWLAHAYARRLRPEHTHLLIDLGLLAPLQQLGVLGGRSYDVLAAALPMQEIQLRLDQAQQAIQAEPDQAQSKQDQQDPAQAHKRLATPFTATLTDFRAPASLVEAEMTALRRATRIVTPHAEVAQYWRERGLTVEQLPWQVPRTTHASRPLPRATEPNLAPLIVFPASALPRKGIDTLAHALQAMNVRLRILGSKPENDAFLHGIHVEYGHYGDDWLARAVAVALPARVEHNPRALLMAAAAGIPVIATPACGLTEADGARLIAPGDAEALRAALRAVLKD